MNNSSGNFADNNKTLATNTNRTLLEKSTDDKFPRKLSEEELASRFRRSLSFYKSTTSLKTMSDSSSTTSLQSSSPCTLTASPMLFPSKTRSPFEQSTDDKYLTISEAELNKRYKGKLLKTNAILIFPPAAPTEKIDAENETDLSLTI